MYLRSWLEQQDIPRGDREFLLNKTQEFNRHLHVVDIKDLSEQYRGEAWERFYRIDCRYGGKSLIGFLCWDKYKTRFWIGTATHPRVIYHTGYSLYCVDSRDSIPETPCRIVDWAMGLWKPRGI